MNIGLRTSALNGLERLAILVLAGLMLVSSAVAADVASEFDSANRLYEQGKFADAAAAYEKIIQSGEISPALYFNLGNAHFKSGKSGEAIAAYRQAEKLAPLDPDLRANLEFVRNQIQGPTDVPGRWQSWLATLTLNGWTLLAAAVLWLWLALLLAGRLRPVWRQSLRNFTRIGGVATVALCGCVAAAVWMDSKQTAIVIAPDAVVRSGPLEESPNAFAVHDGAEVRVLDRKDNWLEIAAGNRVGWLKREQVIEAAGEP